MGLLILLAGCSAKAPSLSLGVQLVTDLRPADEFTEIEVALEDGPTRRSKASGRDYLLPRRVADFDHLRPSARRNLTVRLLDAKRHAVLTRSVELDQRRSITRTVTLTRSCIGMTCEAPKTSCLAGACVDPRCLDGSDDVCAEPGCKADEDCKVSSSCERASCRLGACLVTSDPKLCMDAGVDAGAAHDASFAPDAMLPAPMDGGRDASTDGSVDAGGEIPRCDGGICRLDAACASFDVDTHRYWLCELRLTYADAKAFCAADGAHLAVIGDELENERIAARIAVVAGGSDNRAPHFIGLDDRKLPGDYQWIDASPLSYQNWKVKEPSNSKAMLCETEDCGVVFASGLWNDVCCEARQPFVCEADAP